LPDPAAFFQLFQDLQTTKATATNKLFFGKQPSSSSSSLSSKKPKLNLLCEAAFGLLQWAQQGEPYEFGVQVVATTESEDSEPEPEELLDDDDDDTMLEHEEKVPEWARLEATTTQPYLQEMDAPADFKAQLRPYQRQALWWMTQRESQTELEEWSQQQLQLLKDLASDTTDTDVNVTTQPHTSNNNHNIHCDCGPVTVHININAATATEFAPAVVDNGTSPSLTHPLWERRYLANHDRTKAMSFYVQPLFGMAMASPPPPPQPCRGGILADSM
jgi:hypothetical protein